MRYPVQLTAVLAYALILAALLTTSTSSSVSSYHSALFFPVSNKATKTNKLNMKTHWDHTVDEVYPTDWCLETWSTQTNTTDFGFDAAQKTRQDTLFLLWANQCSLWHISAESRKLISEGDVKGALDAATRAQK